MINIKDIFATLGEIIIVSAMIFGYKIAFLKNSDTPTTLVGCGLIGLGIIVFLKIFGLI